MKTKGFRFFVYGFIVLLSLLLLEFCRRNVGSFAGAYPFAEKWEIDYSIEEVEAALKELQQSDPAIFFQKDSLVLKPDIFAFNKRVDFYYADRHEIVHTFIRGFGNNTHLTLISFNDTQSGVLRLMNRDFNFFANEKEKQIFKTRIIGPIYKILNKGALVKSVN